MGHSTVYYQTHPEARKKKAKVDKKINARNEQVKKRVESNAKVRKYTKKNGHKPSSKGLTYDHAVNGMVLAATNQGRKGEGGRKKKKKIGHKESIKTSTGKNVTSWKYSERSKRLITKEKDKSKGERYKKKSTLSPSTKGEERVKEKSKIKGKKRKRRYLD